MPSVCGIRTGSAGIARGSAIAPLYQLSIYNAAGSLVTMQSLAGHSRVDMRFGIDRAGALYVLPKANGKIWKVTATR